MFYELEGVREECCNALSLICVAKRNLHILHWRTKGQEFGIYHEQASEWNEVLQTATDELVEVTDGADIFLDFVQAVTKSLENPLSVSDQKFVEARVVLQNTCHAVEQADLHLTSAVVLLEEVQTTTVPQSLKAGLDAVAEKLGNLCYQLKRVSAV
jgi:DNA-binding ferritin-like protein